MTTKTQALNQLFDFWELKRPGLKEHFKRDGINCELEYLAAKKRILIICKESNDPDGEANDYRTWWVELSKTDKFSRTIALWAYGLLNDFPDPESYNWEEALSAIQKIAFMNVKKYPGGSSANNAGILDAINRDRNELLEEIRIIEPEIIIGCLNYQEHYEALFGLDLSWENYNPYGVEYGYFKEFLVLKYYHPSGRSPYYMSYALLENAFKLISLNR